MLLLQITVFEQSTLTELFSSKRKTSTLRGLPFATFNSLFTMFNVIFKSSYLEIFANQITFYLIELDRVWGHIISYAISG